MLYTAQCHAYWSTTNIHYSHTHTHSPPIVTYFPINLNRTFFSIFGKIYLFMKVRMLTLFTWSGIPSIYQICYRLCGIWWYKEKSIENYVDIHTYTTLPWKRGNSFTVVFQKNGWRQNDFDRTKKKKTLFQRRRRGERKEKHHVFHVYDVIVVYDKIFKLQVTHARNYLSVFNTELFHF